MVEGALWQVNSVLTLHWDYRELPVFTGFAEIVSTARPQNARFRPARPDSDKVVSTISEIALRGAPPVDEMHPDASSEVRGANKAIWEMTKGQ